MTDRAVQDALLPATTLVGPLALTVPDLERSITFYTEVIGMQLEQRSPGSAMLGLADAPLLTLVEHAGAQPHAPGSTGLYHFAILVPTRGDLGRSLRRLAETRYPLGGASDHLVSEALYLSDPDGNGIEIYRDRPRAEWPWRQGQVQMATEPLDLRALLALAEQEEQPWQGLAAQTRIGHMHLQISNLARAEAFYCGLLGFEVTQRSYPGALFVAAGGYHHHLGLNIWHSRSGRPPAPDEAGLRAWSIVLPDQAALDAAASRIETAGLASSRHGQALALRDPWGILVLLGADPTAPLSLASLA